MGTIHVIEAIGVLMYMLLSRFTGHRLSRQQWWFLACIVAVLIINAIVYYGYFGIGEGDHHHCHYFDHVFYGTSDIMLFILSMLLGFKQFKVAYNMHEFIVKGNLPTVASKKRNKFWYNVIICLSISDISIYIFLNTYWTFVERRMDVLSYFNFGNQLV